VFISKKLLKYLIFAGAVSSGFVESIACHPGVPLLRKDGPRRSSSITTVRLDNLLIAIRDANVDSVKSLIKYRALINQHGEPVTMLVQAILSFNADTNSDNLIYRLEIFELLLDAGAEINNDALTKVEYIKDEELKLKLRNFLETSLLGSVNLQGIIDNAIQNDCDLIIKLFIKSGKIRLENLKELLQKAKNAGSKKVGRLIVAVLRILGGGVGSGDISTTGISSWSPTVSDSELPNEIIDIIACLNA